MKIKSFIVTLAGLFPFMASAICFNFPNGNGPIKIGFVSFNYYNARIVCLDKISSTTEQGHYYLSFGESLAGDLAQLQMKMIAQGRCGINALCLQLQAISGKALGTSLSAVQVASAVVKIEAEYNPDLALKSGRLFMDGKDYSIQEHEEVEHP